MTVLETGLVTVSQIGLHLKYISNIIGLAKIQYESTINNNWIGKIQYESTIKKFHLMEK